MTTDHQSIDAYLASLRSRVIDEAQELGETDPDGVATAFREQAFTSVVIDSLSELGHIEDATLCYFDQRISRGTGKLNAWSLEEDDEHLHLVTTIYRGLDAPTPIARSEIQHAIDRAARVYTAASGGYSADLEPASEEFDMMNRIEECFHKIQRLTIHVFVDGFVGDLSGITGNVEDVEFKFSVWDLRRLDRAESSGLSYEPIELDFVARFGEALPSLQPEGHDADYKTYLTVIPGTTLHSLYHEFGSRLLELNVRSFLQARGKVNQGIRDTLKDEPERFLAYNNGISATAEWVEVSDDGRGLKSITKIRGLQIVNGGQTVASIHRAGENKQDLSNVFVQAKLTVISNDQIDTLVPLISRYANTQNRVNEADFSANHPYHVKIQQMSRENWIPGEESRWFYERARGQYETEKTRVGTTPASRKRFTVANPTMQKFDKVKLAKYQNAWSALPHVVSLGGQKCFVKFMQRLKGQHPSSWVPDEADFRDLIAKAIIFKQAERSARLHKFPAYRANAIAYTVGLIAHRTAGRVDLKEIWNNQSVSSDLEKVIHDWMPVIYDEFVDSAGGRNVTEWCKKEECWRHIQTIDLTIPTGLEAELNSGQPLPTVGKKGRGRSSQLSKVDRENIARVMQVTSDEWLHFVTWGSETGALTVFQTDISATLAGYAARSWSRVPSAKQAAQAVKIINAASNDSGRLADIVEV